MNQKIGTRMNFVIPDDLKAECERIAKKRKMNTSEVIRMMIDLGTSVHRDMERVGLIAAVDFAYFVKKSVKERIADKGNKQLSLL